MTKAEKQSLRDTFQIIQKLTVKVDALEGALIRRGAIQQTDREALELEYLLAAQGDLSAVRIALASLPITQNGIG